MLGRPSIDPLLLIGSCYKASLALGRPELLGEILDIVRVEGDRCCPACKPSQPTLAAAARVSRGWSDLALDLLWRTVQLVDVIQILAPLIVGPNDTSTVSKLYSGRQAADEIYV